MGQRKRDTPLLPNVGEKSTSGIGMIAIAVTAAAMAFVGFFVGRWERSRSRTGKKPRPDSPLPQTSERGQEQSTVREEAARVQTRDLDLALLRNQVAQRRQAIDSMAEVQQNASSATEDRMSRERFFGHPAPSRTTPSTSVTTDQQLMDEEMKKNILREISEQKDAFFGTPQQQPSEKKQVKPEGFDVAAPTPVAVVDGVTKQSKPDELQVQRNVNSDDKLCQDTRSGNIFTADLEAKDAFFGIHGRSAVQNQLLKEENVGTVGSACASGADRQLEDEERKKNFLQEVMEQKDAFFGISRQQVFEKKQVKPEGFGDATAPEPPAAVDAVVKQLKPDKLLVQESAGGEDKVRQDTRSGDIFTTDLDAKDAFFGFGKSATQTSQSILDEGTRSDSATRGVGLEQIMKSRGLSSTPESSGTAAADLNISRDLFFGSQPMKWHPMEAKPSEPIAKEDVPKVQSIPARETPPGSSSVFGSETTTREIDLEEIMKNRGLPSAHESSGNVVTESTISKDIFFGSQAMKVDLSEASKNEPVANKSVPSVQSTATSETPRSSSNLINESTTSGIGLDIIMKNRGPSTAPESGGQVARETSISRDFFFGSQPMKLDPMEASRNETVPKKKAPEVNSPVKNEVPGSSSISGSKLTTKGVDLEEMMKNRGLSSASKSAGIVVAEPSISRDMFFGSQHMKLESAEASESERIASKKVPPIQSPAATETPGSSSIPGNESTARGLGLELIMKNHGLSSTRDGSGKVATEASISRDNFFGSQPMKWEPIQASQKRSVAKKIVPPVVPPAAREKPRSSSTTRGVDLEEIMKSRGLSSTPEGGGNVAAEASISKDMFFGSQAQKSAPMDASQDEAASKGDVPPAQLPAANATGKQPRAPSSVKVSFALVDGLPGVRGDAVKLVMDLPTKQDASKNTIHEMGVEESSTGHPATDIGTKIMNGLQGNGEPLQPTITNAAKVNLKGTAAPDDANAAENATDLHKKKNSDELEMGEQPKNTETTGGGGGDSQQTELTAPESQFEGGAASEGSADAQSQPTQQGGESSGQKAGTQQGNNRGGHSKRGGNSKKSGRKKSRGRH